METSVTLSVPSLLAPNSVQTTGQKPQKQELQVGTVLLYGVRIVSLVIEKQERLCLAQISNTLLKQFSYNEIHNRRVALGITCVQCTPVQLEILRRAGAMPVSSRRCGMITRREAERLCKSFLCDNAPPRLPEDFAFLVHHECTYGCKGAFVPARYNSSRAKCIKCSTCGLFFSPNKFIFHSHQTGSSDKYVQPDAANFNSWRRHMKLSGEPPDEIVHAWEDVKAMFNGGTRKRIIASASHSSSLNVMKKHIKFSNNAAMPSLSAHNAIAESSIESIPNQQRVPPFTDTALPICNTNIIDYMWQQQQQVAVATASKSSSFSILPYLPWLSKRSSILIPSSISSEISNTNPSNSLESTVNNNLHQSAFHPFIRSSSFTESVKLFENKVIEFQELKTSKELSSDDEVDVETTEEDTVFQSNENNANLVSNPVLQLNSLNSQNTLQHCWSPPRETEKAAEKLVDEIKFNTDVQAELLFNKGSENWQKGPFFYGSTIIRGIATVNADDINCSNCRPEESLYRQTQDSPTSIK